MSEKKIVGWAIRSLNNTWVGPLHGKPVPWDWQEDKSKRKIFETREEAHKFFWTCGMTTKAPAAVVRITRREKPKKYYVVAGPFDAAKATEIKRFETYDSPGAAFRIEARPC